MRAVSKTFAALCIGTVVAGCSGSAKQTTGFVGTIPTTVVEPARLPAGHVAHAIEIAEAIKASGIGCDKASIENDVPTGAGNPVERVSCDIGDDSVVISFYADHDSLLSAMPFIRQGTCYVATRQPSNTTYVQGENWIVFPQKASTVSQIAAAIGGAPTTIHC